MNLHNVEFLISAARKTDFPKNRLPEIAFAGKSNVGKSSVINRLLNRKNFARVGEKPGKTIHVNYFTVDKCCYFVDLPGYGYAKVPQSEKTTCQDCLSRCLSVETVAANLPLALSMAQTLSNSTGTREGRARSNPVKPFATRLTVVACLRSLRTKSSEVSALRLCIRLSTLTVPAQSDGRLLAKKRKEFSALP